MASSARRVCLREEPQDQALAAELRESNGFTAVAHAFEVGRGVADGEQVGVRHKEAFEKSEQHRREAFA